MISTGDLSPSSYSFLLHKTSSAKWWQEMSSNWGFHALQLSVNQYKHFGKIDINMYIQWCNNSTPRIVLTQEMHPYVHQRTVRVETTQMSIPSRMDLSTVPHSFKKKTKPQSRTTWCISQCLAKRKKLDTVTLEIWKITANGKAPSI